jgi:hypothetical protein
MSKKNNNEGKKIPTEEISRREAIRKAGKYAAFTATSMLIVLSPKESQAQSPTPRPGW